MSNEPSQEKSLLTVLKEAVFFLAIYLYFMGFVYISFFYETFGIPLRSIDTPVYYFFVYSFNVFSGLNDIDRGSVLKQKPLWTIIVVTIAICAALMVARWKTRKGIIIGGVLIVLFPVVYYVAQATAKADALKVRTQQTAKAITFVFKKETSPKNSIRLIGEFKNGKDEEESKPGAGPKKGQPRKNSVQGTSGGTKNEDDTKRSAELEGLQRFLEANDRIDLDEKHEGNFTTYWPKLYLITETSTTFYVFLQPSLDSGSLSWGYVYEVFKSDVLLSEVKITD